MRADNCRAGKFVTGWKSQQGFCVALTASALSLALQLATLQPPREREREREEKSPQTEIYVAIKRLLLQNFLFTSDPNFLVPIKARVDAGLRLEPDSAATQKYPSPFSFAVNFRHWWRLKWLNIRNQSSVVMSSNPGFFFCLSLTTGSALYYPKSGE